MAALADLVANTLDACSAALDAEECARIRVWLKSSGMDVPASVEAVHHVTKASASQRPVLTLRRALSRDLPDLAPGALERYLLLTAARESLLLLGAQPLAADVKRLICEEFASYVNPRMGRGDEFTAGHNRFGTSCMIASLRRFPAGQFDWEVSGFPRSWFLRLRGRAIIRVPQYLLTRVGGRHPMFFRHFGIRRPLIIAERAADRSYLRMAESMRHQPQIRGLLACGWFSSEATHRVSPHLAWANRTICDNGGIAVGLGPADPSCGVLARSPERQRLYETGEFKPTLGLVMWDRESMLRWATQHQ